jgi:predicted nucleic acid-binding protein
MRVVSNTSSILNLAIIDQLHLLREQMGKMEEKAGFFIGAELRRRVGAT